MTSACGICEAEHCVRHQQWGTYDVVTDDRWSTALRLVERFRVSLGDRVVMLPETAVVTLAPPYVDACFMEHPARLGLKLWAEVGAPKEGQPIGRLLDVVKRQVEALPA